MKKNLFRLITCAALSLFIFAGCDLNIENSYYRKAVTIEKQTTGVAIGFPKINTTNSISVYRYKVTGDTLPVDPSGTNTTGDMGIIIGLVYPEQYPDKEVYIFTDEYALKGGKYCYRVRYNNSDGEYSYTKWSDPVVFDGTSMGVANEVWISDNTISLTSNNLQLNAPVAWDFTQSFFDDNFYLALECAEEGEAYLFPLNTVQANGAVSIPLSTIIPLNWYNKNVKVKGLVAIKKIETEGSDKKIKQYIYTPASNLSLEKDGTVEPAGTFKYESASKENIIEYL